MKVSELIEALQGFDDDAEVGFVDRKNYFFSFSDVEARDIAEHFDSLNDEWVEHKKGKYVAQLVLKDDSQQEIDFVVKPS